jgi:FkbM family methyltransferase
MIVSPHLDDAVLSAWSVLSERDAQVTVVTVFAGIPPEDTPLSEWDRDSAAENAAELMRARREEDVSALAMCGADHIHLDFLDVAYRTAPVSLGAVAATLGELAADADEVYIPAGLGRHVDHVATARAALDAARGRSVHMYADAPYASRQWAAALVAADEDGRLRWLDAVLDTAPLAPPELPRSVQLTEAQVAAKRGSLQRYASQLAPLGNAFPGFSEDEALAREWVWDVEMHPSAARPLDLLPGPLPPPGAASERPFLSVLVRTQGMRPEPLAVALESLVRQRCRDFELILLLHNPAPDASGRIAEAVDSFPRWLRDSTRVETVVGGGRARPLNFGLRLAAGRYVAVLDDDDLALPEWVETFRQLATREPGKVLRAGALASDPRDRNHSFVYPIDFDFLEHVVGDNQTPCCALAFPLGVLRFLDIELDESLDLVEDWDLLLRVAPLAGVSTSPQITSHHQQWGLGDDSRARHSPVQWRAAIRRVVDKADRRPLILPPGTVRPLREARLKHESEVAEARERYESEVAALRQELAEARNRYASEVEARERYESEVAALRDELAEARNRYESEVEARSQEVAATAEAFARSKSWRITAPLRVVGRAMRRSRSRVSSQGAPPAPVSPAGHDAVRAAAGTSPAPGAVDWGDLRRLRPFSEVYGFDRGTPLDRPYIADFLRARSSLIRGTVLEVQDPYYTRAFGAGVVASDVVDLNPENPLATIVADLNLDGALPAERYDCIILTQTLQFLDPPRALRNLYAALAPGGVLLLTVPCLARSEDGYRDADYLRWTPPGLVRQLEQCLPGATVQVEGRGNILTCVAYLLGISAEEIDPEEVAQYDPDHPLLALAEVRKPESSSSVDETARLMHDRPTESRTRPAVIPLTFHAPRSVTTGVIDEVLRGEYESGYTGEQLTVLDIGANVGAFSIWAAHRWPGSTVDAYEPNPGTFALLERNTRTYQMVRCHNRAVYPSETRNERFFFRGVGDGEAGLIGEVSKTFNSDAISKGKRIRVPVLHPRELPSADVVKIDVEGAEAAIVTHADLSNTSLILLEFQNRLNLTTIKAHLAEDFDVVFERREPWSALLSKQDVYEPTLAADEYGLVFLVRRGQTRMWRPPDFDRETSHAAET